MKCMGDFGQPFNDKEDSIFFEEENLRLYQKEPAMVDPSEYTDREPYGFRYYADAEDGEGEEAREYFQLQKEAVTAKTSKVSGTSTTVMVNAENPEKKPTLTGRVAVGVGTVLAAYLVLR